MLTQLPQNDDIATYVESWEMRFFLFQVCTSKSRQLRMVALASVNPSSITFYFLQYCILYVLYPVFIYIYIYNCICIYIYILQYTRCTVYDRESTIEAILRQVTELEEMTEALMLTFEVVKFSPFSPRQPLAFRQAYLDQGESRVNGAKLKQSGLGRVALEMLRKNSACWCLGVWKIVVRSRA